MSPPPFFTLIIAVKDGLPGLAACLASIVGQSCPDWELIVMDGGSRDGSVALLREHAARITHWESTPDRGIAHAWNKALARACGEWVIFLGADDRLWDGETLARLRPRLAILPPECGVAYGQVMGITPTGGLAGPRCPPWERARFLHHGSYFSHQGVCHRRRLFTEQGGFDESFRYAMDYEWLLRELKTHDPAYLPEVTVAAMGLGGISNDIRLGGAVLREFRRARRRQGITGPAWPLAWRQVKAWGKAGLALVMGKRGMDKVVARYRAWP